MKPNIIIRKGNRFVIDEARVLPYMRKNMDLVIAAISSACKELKDSPDNFRAAPIDKLTDLNNRVYALLTEWNVYKE